MVMEQSNTAMEATSLGFFKMGLLPRANSFIRTEAHMRDSSRIICRKGLESGRIQ